MYCPYCNAPAPDDAAFCGNCGRPFSQEYTRELHPRDLAGQAAMRMELPLQPVPEPTTVLCYEEQLAPPVQPMTQPVQPEPQPAQEKTPQQQYEEEVTTMRALLKHFSEKKSTYNAYDRVCNDLRRDRGASKAMLIWGILLLTFALLLTISLLNGDFLSDAIALLLIFGIPGLLLLLFGIKKLKNHKEDRDELLEEYRRLSVELIRHYQRVKNCPIPPEYTNPDILMLFYNQLTIARATTIRGSVAAVVDNYHRGKARDYLQGVHLATSDIDRANGIRIHFVIPSIF